MRNAVIKEICQFHSRVKLLGEIVHLCVKKETGLIHKDNFFLKNTFMSVRLQITPFQSSMSSFGSGGCFSGLGLGVSLGLVLLSRTCRSSIEHLGELRGNNGESTSPVLVELSSSNLGGVSNVSITPSLRSNSDNSSVDSARNRVVLLNVDLGKVELIW